METKNHEIEKMLDLYDAGGMTRRSFLAKLSALGVTAFVANAVSLSPLGALKAFAAINGPEERAWELAKAAAAKATKKTLTLLIPTGSIGNMTALRGQVEERARHHARIHRRARRGRSHEGHAGGGRQRPAATT